MNPSERARVWLVGDDLATFDILRALLRHEAEVEHASDPGQALARAAAGPLPDLVLLESGLADWDGLEFCRRLKASVATAEVPVVLLDQGPGLRDAARALEAGVADFLDRPIDPPVALARLRGQLALRRCRAELASQRALVGRELAEAADYVRGLLPPPMTGTVASDWQYLPSASLGGDAFGHHWLDADRLAIYLFDVSGQGVGAALLSLSVMHALRSQTLHGADFRSPASVLTALNEAFPMEAHGGRFFTLWYGVLDLASRELAFASAGHPPALLVSEPGAGGAPLRELTTWNMAIGLVPGLAFEGSSVKLGRRAKLVVLSDGVYDTAGPGGTPLGFAEFVIAFGAMAEVGRPQSADILAAMRRMKGGVGEFEDDFSLLEVLLDAE